MPEPLPFRQRLPEQGLNPRIDAPGSVPRGSGKTRWAARLLARAPAPGDRLSAGVGREAVLPASRRVEFGANTGTRGHPGQETVPGPPRLP